MRRELEASRAYSDIYAKAVALFKEYNPCQFNPNTGFCKAYSFCENNPDAYGYDRKYILCCAGCSCDKRRKHQHSRKSGCRVKSLACKLYLCCHIEDKMPKEFLQRLSTLRSERRKLENTYGTMDCYQTKGDWIKRITEWKRLILTQGGRSEDK